MYSLRRYDWILHLATIVVCAFFLAKGITTYLGGVLESATAVSLEGPSAPPLTDEEDEAAADLEAYQVIEDRNVFNSAEIAVAEEATDETEGLQAGELGPAVKTSLDIKVQSTLVVGEGTDRRSSAIVTGAKSRAGQAYFVGDDEESFAPNVKLTKVEKDRIEFINAGRLEYAELEDWGIKGNIFASPEDVFGNVSLAKEDKGGSPVPSSGSAAGKVVLDQKEVDDALQNLDKLAREVRIVPNFQNGRLSGMKVLSIRPGGLISKLGVRRGDVLTKVNGEELDIKRGMELFNSMKDLKNFSLDVVRGGKNQTLEYEIR